MYSYFNHLAGETSPYLLQHVHNPVDWYPWGDEALQKAKLENKPILVSIGYSACHWCHVMERESFEDAETAAIMNKYFINIKIDREERPDLDHIYMDAVQALTGSGGWPLNVFLTPGLKPFYGGTYYPPVRAYNRASWKEVLINIATAFAERRNEIEEQANGLTEHLQKANSFGVFNAEKGDADFFIPEKAAETFLNVMKQADTEYGGFGKAPKFPQTFTIQFLLRHHYVTGSREALQQACLSLDKMIAGGIYDQLGGGFARYSTDTEWLAPHFEKMLYDNALLLIVLSEAYQLTKNDQYKYTIEETLEFIKRELMDENGAFYAAIDADSEGEEGRFYVWSLEEINKILGKDAPLFCAFYDVTAGGNWEHKNILRIKTPQGEFAVQNGMKENELSDFLKRTKEKLLAYRNTRPRPLLDDKVITGWNALMITACCKAYAATGEISYRDMAVQNMLFLEKNLRNNVGGFFHTWKEGQARYPAFLDDYALIIQAMIQLHEVTADTYWLKRADELADYVIKHFSDTASPFFFYTPEEQENILIRKKEIYDGAVPSGNSVMACNLYYLGLLFDKPALRKRTEQMVKATGRAIVLYPTSFGIWATLLQEMVYGTNEIAVVGKGADLLSQKILHEYIPHKILMNSEAGSEFFPLLKGKEGNSGPLIYLCRNYSCRQPVSEIKDLLSELSIK